jgi:hypothetical protein
MFIHDKGRPYYALRGPVFGWVASVVVMAGCDGGGLNLRAPLKIVIFFVRARKHRPESRSLRGVNEDSRTELTPLSRKKCIFRDALK